ncbi:hypothetical protein HHI36_005500 [Cryptolaemus montrouzieri]|uniref:Uncharacterized protein n=1 Tax=Cryptolaemus montrouzieri TaxID=559131 RepID=A0ABD2NVB7_9CUCU
MNNERIRSLLQEESSSGSNYDDEFDSEVENGSSPQEKTRDFEDEIQSSDREDDSQSEQKIMKLVEIVTSEKTGVCGGIKLLDQARLGAV